MREGKKPFGRIAVQDLENAVVKGFAEYKGLSIGEVTPDVALIDYTVPGHSFFLHL